MAVAVALVRAVAVAVGAHAHAVLLALHVEQPVAVRRGGPRAGRRRRRRGPCTCRRQPKLFFRAFRRKSSARQKTPTAPAHVYPVHLVLGLLLILALQLVGTLQQRPVNARARGLLDGERGNVGAIVHALVADNDREPDAAEEALACSAFLEGQERAGSAGRAVLCCDGGWSGAAWMAGLGGAPSTAESASQERTCCRQ